MRPLTSIFFFFSTCASLANPGTIASTPKESWDYWETVKNIPYQYTDLRVNDRIVIRGIPGHQHNLNVEALTKDQIKKTVFKHYTTPSTFNLISTTRTLKAGEVAYISSPFIFIDLIGVFLTLPECSAESVGLDYAIHKKWVQLMVDHAYPVIKIEKCIFLVPGKPKKPEWANDPYPGFQLPIQITNTN
jgi:hypothetical protein